MNNEQAQNALDNIDSNGRGLSDWEIDFVESMLKKTDDGYAPTPKEEAIILRIEGEKVR